VGLGFTAPSRPRGAHAARTKRQSWKFSWPRLIEQQPVTIRIIARGNLNQDSFDNAVQRTEDDQRLLVVDLRRCLFVDPYALVTLLTIMTVAVEEYGYSCRLRLPQSQSTRTYLARARFFELLPNEVVADRVLPTVAARSGFLVPLDRLDVRAGDSAVETLARFVYPQLPRQFRESFTEGIIEIGSNVVAHSGATVGFIAGQRYEREFQRRLPPRLHLVVGDAGVGIQASLAQAHPEVESMTEADAIRMALQDGMTGKPGDHSGVGLGTVRNDTRAFAGVMRIRSGAATVVLRPSGEKAVQVPRLRGTIVSVELSSPGRRGAAGGS
jgi:hypothetical protein